jgi:hypothetical protein
MWHTHPGPAEPARGPPRLPGAGGADLVTPYQRPMPTQCAPLDPLPPGTLPLGVTLSGGSFRATLAGLGMLHYLSDAGLRRARSISIATAPPAAQGESDNSSGSHIDRATM